MKALISIYSNLFKFNQVNYGKNFYTELTTILGIGKVTEKKTLDSPWYMSKAGSGSLSPTKPDIYFEHMVDVFVDAKYYIRETKRELDQKESHKATLSITVKC